MPPSSLNPLIFRDNSEGLRYLLLVGAAGICALVFNSLTGADRDVGTIIGKTLGALLLAFSGCVLQVRRLAIDPVRLEISVVSKDLVKTVTGRFGFNDVQKLFVKLTYDHDEGFMPPHRQKPRWSIFFMLKNRSIPVTVSPYVSKDQAMREARCIQELAQVGISDNLEEGLTQLADAGRTIDAVIVARQQLGMTLMQAKEAIDQTADRRKTPLSPRKLESDHHLR